MRKKILARKILREEKDALFAKKFLRIYRSKIYDFTPKKRSLLSEEAIDDLIFEKGYFENEGWKYL